MYSDRRSDTTGKECHAGGSREETKVKQFMYRDRDYVEHEMFDHRVIIWAAGKVTKDLKKYLEAIPGEHSVDWLQKTAVLGTWHKIRDVMQSETWSLSGGFHLWFKRINTRKKDLWQETTTTTITQ